MLGSGILSGKKTYVTGVLAIIGAVASYLTGDLELGAAVNLIVPAVLAMTVRHGISTSTE